MKNVLKLVMLGVGLLVLLLVVGVLIAFRSIDAIAKKAIEGGGTYVLGVKTTVDSADVGVFAGTFRMSGLSVANPEGYKSDHFMKLPSAGMDVTLGTLMEDTIRLPQLTIGKLDINLDGSGGTANYKQILEHIKGLESGGSQTGAKSEGKKFVIETLTIEGATVHVVNLGGVSQAVGAVEVDVPQVKLEGVGTKEPLGLDELVSVIVKTVLSTTVQAGGGIIPADVLGDLQGQLAGLSSLGDLGITAVGDVGQIAGQLAGEAQKQAEEQINKAAEEVKGQIDDAAKKLEDKLKGLGKGGG